MPTPIAKREMPLMELSIEDEEAARDGDKLVSRVFFFADGQPRLMTYTARQGAHLQALFDDGWTVEEFLSTAYDTAKEQVETGVASDFENELRLCLAQAMKFAWWGHSKQVRLRKSKQFRQI